MALRNSVMQLTILVAVFLTGCATETPARLTTDDLGRLRSLPLMVIYKDAAMPMSVYISMPTPPPLPAVGGVTPAVSSSGTDDGSSGPMFNPIWDAWTNVGSAVLSAIFPTPLDRAHTRIRPFLPLIANMPLANEEYAAAQGAVGQVSWLGKAQQQHVEWGGATRVIQQFMMQPGPRVSIVLTPAVRFRDDTNQLVVAYQVNIYVKDIYSPPGSSNLEKSAVVGGVWTADKAHGMPTVEYSLTNQGDILDKSVPQFFSDGGIQFRRDFEAALAEATLQISAYFSGG